MAGSYTSTLSDLKREASRADEKGNKTAAATFLAAHAVCERLEDLTQTLERVAVKLNNEVMELQQLARPAGFGLL
jgi:hypothetical protein